MKKRAKSLLVYGALIFVFVLASVVLVKAIASYSQGDSSLTISYNLVTEAKAGRVYTPSCLVDCHLPFCFTPSSSSASTIPVTKNDVTQTLNFAQGSDQSILKEIGVDYLTTETYTENVPEYGTCQGAIYNNVTGQNESYSYNCITGSTPEQKIREVWKPLKDISQLNLESGKEQCLDIRGKLQPKTNANFAVDIIPHLNLQNKDFILSEYAWWLSNYSYRRSVFFNSTISSNVKNTPVPINGSEGFRISSGREHAWCLLGDLPTSNSSMLFYYNNITDYKCVNASDDTESSKDVEMGNGTSINSKNIWRSNYATHIFHFNGSSANASGGSGTATGVTYSDSGLIGKGAVFDNTNDEVAIGDFNTDNTDTSFEFWIYPTSTPGGLQMIFDDYATAAGPLNGRGWQFGLNATLGIAGQIDATAACSSGDNLYSGIHHIPLNEWSHIVLTFTRGSSGAFKAYVNGTLKSTQNFCIDGGVDNAVIGGLSDTGFSSGIIDEFRIYNKTLSDDEVKAHYQLTSPALKWNILGTEQTTSAALETQGDQAIVAGISLSAINSSYITYTERQLYSRNVTGNQTLGRFDAVAAYGNQRWAFNYIASDENTSNYTKMVNITPTLYVWEGTNLSSDQISSQVTAFINSTKV